MTLHSWLDGVHFVWFGLGIVAGFVLRELLAMWEAEGRQAPRFWRLFKKGRARK